MFSNILLRPNPYLSSICESDQIFCAYEHSIRHSLTVVQLFSGLDKIILNFQIIRQ